MLKLLALLLIPAALFAQRPNIVAVHVPSWDVHMGAGTNGNYGDMPVDSIDFSTMTHYISFACNISSTGSAMQWGNNVSSRRRPLNDRIHAAGKPVLLCLGGWGSDGNFSSAFSPTYRQATINLLLNVIKTEQYDGLDWDWEPFGTSDSANLFPTIRALADTFNQPWWRAYYNPSKKLIQTADINPGTGGIARVWAKIQEHMEFIMVMSYDKIGTWTEMVYFDYAPYSRIGNQIVDRIGMRSTTQEMATAQMQGHVMLSNGISPQKVVIGIDFMAGMASGGAGTSTGGVTRPRQTWTSAPSFVNDFKFDEFYQQYLHNASASVKKFDDTAKAYYLSINNALDADDKFIGYAGGPGQDSTLYYHVKLANEMNIGGIMIWDLSECYLGTGRFPASSYPNLERNWLTNQMRKHLGGTPPPPPPMDSDGDGVNDPLDLCPGTLPGTSVDANGCPLPPPPPVIHDTIYVQVIVRDTVCPNPPPPPVDTSKKVRLSFVQGPSTTYSVLATVTTGAQDVRVIFYDNGALRRTENAAPYYLFGDQNNAPIWGTLGGGVHTVVAILYPQVGSTVISRDTLRISNGTPVGALPPASSTAPEIEVVPSYELSQNSPNPFNPVTFIEFSLPEAVDVKLDIYTMLGQHVGSPVSGELLPAGRHTVAFDGSRWPSGTYVYVLSSRLGTIRKLMTLIK